MRVAPTNQIALTCRLVYYAYIVPRIALFPVIFLKPALAIVLVKGVINLVVPAGPKRC